MYQSSLDTYHSGPFNSILSVSLLSHRCSQIKLPSPMPTPPNWTSNLIWLLFLSVYSSLHCKYSQPCICIFYNSCKLWIVIMYATLYPRGVWLAALPALSKHGCIDRCVDFWPEQNHTTNTNCMQYNCNKYTLTKVVLTKTPSFQPFVTHIKDTPHNPMWRHLQTRSRQIFSKPVHTQ